MRINPEQAMNYAATKEQPPTVVPFTRRGPADSGALPGIEGLYAITADGQIGRYQGDGHFQGDPKLSARFSAKIKALLRQYRSGDADRLALGLVTPSTPDKPWTGASLIFSDGTLRQIFKTSDDSNAPLTSFQRRNKVKSIYQGMELVLETKNPAQPQLPRYCPVLFDPEVSGETLRERYNAGAVDTRKVLEVLDLMIPCSPEEQKDPALADMVLQMTQNKISPEARSAPELTLVGDVTGDDIPTSFSVANPQDNPWEAVPEDRDSCFNDGDPVTYWLLAGFAPFNELNDLQRQFVARGHVVTKKRAGTTLIERGSRDDTTIYLVEGTLELEAYDGKKISIVGGTRRAHLPISQLRPHAYTVRAATDVSIIVVSQDMVREITRVTTTYKSRPGIEVRDEDSLPDDILASLSTLSGHRR